MDTLTVSLYIASNRWNSNVLMIIRINKKWTRKIYPDPLEAKNSDDSTNVKPLRDCHKTVVRRSCHAD